MVFFHQIARIRASVSVVENWIVVLEPDGADGSGQQTVGLAPGHVARHIERSATRAAKKLTARLRGCSLISIVDLTLNNATDSVML